MATKYDYLIIGQGLAGSLVGFRLAKAGKSVAFIDHPQQVAASNVAAGIINPITGRRFVKSWQIEQLLPIAKQLYKQLELELGLQLWYDYPLIRTLFNRGDQNNWDVRSLDPAYLPFCAPQADLGEYDTLTKPAFAYAEVMQTARVDIDALTKHYREKLRTANRFYATNFDPNKLVLYPDHVQYDELQAQAVIFCEGWRGKFNPWFKDLPFGGAKGDVLNVQLEAPTAKRMLKHRIFLVPQADGTYWVGSTNENQFSTEAPDPKNAQFLVDRLTELVTVPFKVLAHKAAVRPTVKDRRPFLGQHPEHKRLYIFNGLGTKGASLAPYCSDWFVNYLLQDTPLPAAVDIKRFQ